MTQDGYDWPNGCTDERWPPPRALTPCTLRDAMLSAAGRAFMARDETGALHLIGSAPKPGTEWQECWCHTCRPLGLDRMEMVLCPKCGNKRCPKANDHRHACTGSNDSGQAGSAYP